MNATDRMVDAVVSGTCAWCREWVKNELDPNFQKNSAHENYANYILEVIKETSHSNDRTRYKFCSMSTCHAALEAIFNRSYIQNSSQIILAAEQIRPSEAPFYPRWRTVCWIQIPRSSGAIIGSTIVKIALVVSAAYAFNRAGYGFYRLTTDLTQRSLPWFINNTPIELIRIGNRALDIVSWPRQWATKNFLPLLIASLNLDYHRSTILAAPHIPLLTPLVRRVSFFGLLKLVTASPATIGFFLFCKSIQVSYSLWSVCNTVESFFNGRVRRAEADRDATCKSKAYAVWKEIALKNHF